MHLVGQPTPDPDARKFQIPFTSGCETGVTFTWSSNRRRLPPVARSLLRQPGVAAVYIQDDFITLTRRRGCDWDDLAPRVSAVLLDEIGGRGISVPRRAEPAPGSEVDRAICSVLRLHLREMLAREGGGILLQRFVPQTSVAWVAFTGAWERAPTRQFVLARAVEPTLRLHVPQVGSVSCIEPHAASFAARMQAVARGLANACSPGRSRRAETPRS